MDADIASADRATDEKLAQHGYGSHGASKINPDPRCGRAGRNQLMTITVGLPRPAPTSVHARTQAQSMMW
jgi:hypothetical protein